MKKIKLSDVIQQVNELDWKLAIYSDEKEKSFEKDTVIYLANPDKERVDETKYFYGLSIQTLQDIIENASPEDLLKAINFYYKNDAFVDFNVGK
ncbi:hypothetical protein ACFLZP_02470 [Patescibacteria group bacterium]